MSVCLPACLSIISSVVVVMYCLTTEVSYSTLQLDPANVARKRRAVDSSNSSKVAPEPGKALTS